MTAQKIANILHCNGYYVNKNYNGYQTAYYTVKDKNTKEIIFECKGAKDLKDWFYAMDSNFNLSGNYDSKKIPDFNLDGRYQK